MLYTYPLMHLPITPPIIVISATLGKAFSTSLLPGLTRKLTGTVKIHEDPSVYVYDMPGIMVPFLGKGVKGVEKGLRLALTSMFALSLECGVGY